MSVVDARASDPQDVEATRIRPRSAETPAAPAAAAVPGGGIDPDATRQGRLRTPSASRNAEPSPAPCEAYIGRVFGDRYQLEELLGAGGMSVVYRASDLQVPGESFAIKVLKPKLQGHPELMQVLREELRKTRVLSHPNIVGAYSINSDADGDYMLMEYLEGETLQKLLDKEFGRGVPFERAWPFITDICAALAYAHDHNVVHSDLKPSNVFVTTCGRVKLLDFGIARVARGPIHGFDPGAYGAATESYASCELLEGGAADPRDDVYALGCVVYEMLSGRHPFGRRSASEARDLKLQPSPLSSLSRRQNAALAKALCFEREQRTASVETFQSQMQSPRGVGWPTLALGSALAIVLAAVVPLSRTRLSPPGPPAATPAGVTAPVPSPPSTATAAALAAVQALGQKAAALGVDPDDSLLKVGLSALEDARARLRAGAPEQAQGHLDEARGSLTEALRMSPRIVTVGSTPAEISTALQLCREETGNSADCTATAFADEKARRVSLRPFTLDAAPATNAEFAQFAAKTGYVTAAERANGLYAAAETAQFLRGASWKTLREQDLPAQPDAADYPARGIDYAAAKAYCEWRGKRLPSEDEWEFAARGASRKIFSWGDSAAGAPGTGSRELLPVAKESATGAFGNRGLGGAVWEWAEGTADARPILRGPSYLVTLPFYQRLATRERENPGRARVDTGVRCATSSEAWPEGPASSLASPRGS